MLVATTEKAVGSLDRCFRRRYTCTRRSNIPRQNSKIHSQDSQGGTMHLYPLLLLLLLRLRSLHSQM